MLLAGCARTDPPRDPLVARAERAVAELERLQPRLAKAGTPGADELAERLGEVRTGLASLPPPVTIALAEEPKPKAPPVVARVRCPDLGCWRLGIQAEAGLWTVHLRGGGDRIEDTGPLALGLAVGLEKSRPVDHRLEWSWGGEMVGTLQDRADGQRIGLVGFRPVVRAALALSDSFALTLRPLVEIGQATLRLGSEPGGVLDRADVYAAIGLRAGWRWRLANSDLIGEIGWRHVWFNASAGELSYRIDIDSPEIAIGWGRRL